MIKKKISWFLLFTALTGLLCAGYVPEKLTSELHEAYNNSDDNDMLPIYIIMAEQYPSERLYEMVRPLNKNKRRQQTIKILKEFRETTQNDIKTVIENLQDDRQVNRLFYLWITNVIGMEATKEAISLLSNHPDVGMIHYDPPTYALELKPEEYAFEEESNDIHRAAYVSLKDTDKKRRAERGQERTSQNSGNKFRNNSYNVDQVNAPDVWEAGFTGEGVIVAVLDTGVNYLHHDIRNRMWEHPDFPNHGYNFFSDNNNPMDGHSHGTHCAGTVAGDGTSGTNTGMAPGARIMALKVLSDAGSGQHHMLWAAMEFGIEYDADIMSVSLGWTNVAPEARTVFRDVSSNVLASGIVIAKSAGNRGTQQGTLPIPRNLTVPGDCPPPWLSPDQFVRGGVSAMISVGSTDNNDVIATSSSRGPVTWQDVDEYGDYPYNPGMGLIKPDICAPGVNVMSLDRTDITGYRQMSGTSMAAPGVAGVIALMLSKNPNLLPEEIGRIIEETAFPLSETKSNTYGAGRIDAFEAVEASAFVGIEDITFSDDNNNIPEYDEEVRINVTVINLGVEEMDNIVGTLDTDDQYINIINNTADFGVIDIDSTATVNDAFTIRIADNIPDKYKVVFNLNLAVDEDTDWDNNFEMIVRAPNIASNVFRVYDPLPGGNDNGFIDPGEDVILYLPVTNRGGASSPPINVTVNSETDLAVINEISQTEFPRLINGETVYPSISVTVSDEAEYETLLPFSYSYRSGNYLFEGRINAVVGGIIPAQMGEGDEVTANSIANPINQYFRSLRSQTIYTAEELNEAGVSGPLPLTQIGYFVAGQPEHPLPDFVVRMKHTNAVDASAHDDGPFETVFQTAEYIAQAGRWDMLDLNNPFIWNGEDNILVDTAFSPVQGWSSTGQIRFYNQENSFRYTRADSPDQTNEPTRMVSNHKPQILMIFNTTQDEGATPGNLIAELSGLEVHLSWEAPEDNRSQGNPNYRARRSSPGRFTGQTFTRNPDGYNIYRNGFLLNDELVEELGFIDDEYDAAHTYYYYVTAVYGENESSPSNIADVRFRVAAPEFSSMDRIHYEPFLLTLTCDTPDVEIYYTLDGSGPTIDDILYEHPISIEFSEHVRARAFKDNWLASETVSKQFVILHPPRNLRGSPQVNRVRLIWDIPSEPASQIGRDTFDHSMITSRNSRNRNFRSQTGQDYRNLNGYSVYRAVLPDSFIVINSELITINRFTDEHPPAGELKYYVTARYSSGESMPSGIISLNGIVAKPEFSKEPGEYTGDMLVSISTSTANAVIYYTLDEEEPDSSSDIFDHEQPLQLLGTTTIKAYAVLDGWQDSDVVTGEFISLSTDEPEAEFETALHNAYPNPFNPQTVIEFSLRAPDYVSIDVFNIAGQKIVTLINDELQPGIHRIIWNGEDEKSDKTPSGIYFYRMITSDFIETKKVLLLK